MTAEQLAEFRERLEKLRAEVEASLAGTAEDAKPVDLGLAIGRLSRIDALQQQQMTVARRQRLESQLEQVRAALARLAGDTYGECLTCGGPIGVARLRIRPEAPFCRDCQAGAG